MLYIAGHIQTIAVHTTATASDVEQLVRGAFSSLPAIVKGTASLYGFVLLAKISRGKGAHGRWVVNKRAGEFTIQDLQWCVRLHVILHVANAGRN